MKKPSNWLTFVKLRPKRNEYLVRTIMELRCKGVVDDLLRAAANFLQIKSPEVRELISVNRSNFPESADVFRLSPICGNMQKNSLLFFFERHLNKYTENKVLW